MGYPGWTPWSGAVTGVSIVTPSSQSRPFTRSAQSVDSWSRRLRAWVRLGPTAWGVTFCNVEVNEVCA
jgi:hypothetical protein